MTTVSLLVFAPPESVQCPTCDAASGLPCVAIRAGKMMNQVHVNRKRRPMLYKCAVCGDPFKVSEALQGAWVHLWHTSHRYGHQPRPYDDLRAWRP